MRASPSLRASGPRVQPVFVARITQNAQAERLKNMRGDLMRSAPKNSKKFRVLTALALGALGPALAWAADAPVPNKGDTAWMMTSTALVLLMAVPALGLFYGGLVRSKNMLSVLMQVFVGFAL